MMDSWGATNQRDVFIMPWGAPHPYCPGCQKLPKTIPQSHTCPKLNGLITTAHEACPFCEAGEKTESDKGASRLVVRPAGAESREAPAVGRARPEAVTAEAVTAEAVTGDHSIPAPDWVQIESEASTRFLAEFEKTAAEFQALQANALAREAAALERLRRIEIQLAQEEFRRTMAEWKSKGIEEALRRRPDYIGKNHESGVKTVDTDESPVERFLFEALSLIAEATAQLGAERNARLATEPAEDAAEICGVEFAVEDGPQEPAHRAFAEERNRQAEIELARDLKRVRERFAAEFASVAAGDWGNGESANGKLLERAQEGADDRTKDRLALSDHVAIAPQDDQQAVIKVCKATASVNQVGGAHEFEITESARPDAIGREVEVNGERLKRPAKMESPRLSPKPRVRPRRNRRREVEVQKRPGVATRLKPRRKGRPHF
jgi:hypothetical protein